MQITKTIKISIISTVTCIFVLACVFYSSACTNKVEEPKSFAFDSWSTISKVAEGGLDNLKSVYRPLYGSFIIKDLDDPNEVLAKTRQILIEGVGKFTVRVIGESHDICEDGKTSALTFEFCDLINEVYFTFNNEYSNSWEKSNLRSFLNTKFFDSLSSDLKSVIKVVNKDTVIGGTKEIVSTKEQVFALSATEINVAQSYNQKEGNPYKFYLDHAYVPNSKDDPRNRDNKTYWLRTPACENTICAYVIRYDKDDRYFNELALEDVLNRTRVAPCFCI